MQGHHVDRLIMFRPVMSAKSRDKNRTDRIPHAQRLFMTSAAAAQRFASSMLLSRNPSLPPLPPKHTPVPHRNTGDKNIRKEQARKTLCPCCRNRRPPTVKQTAATFTAAWRATQAIFACRCGLQPQPNTMRAITVPPELCRPGQGQQQERAHVLIEGG